MEGLTISVVVSKAGELCFSLDITQVPFTLGASPRCDVVLDDAYVSRKHAVVTLTRGQLHFADTSSNGSFFRGRRIVSQLLDTGDTVEIPPFEVRFEYALEDDEERRTALRGLSELISPQLRERMRAAAPASPVEAGPRRAAPTQPEVDQAVGPVEEVGGTDTPPAPPAEAPPPGVGPDEEPTPVPPVETADRSTAEAEGMPPSVTGHAPVVPTPPPPTAALVEGASPEVTMVPVPPAPVGAGEAGPRAEALAPPPLPPPAEAAEETTAIVPPPPPLPSRRPAVSRTDDRLPGARATTDGAAAGREEEPPTIAFATIRPEPAKDVGGGTEEEGTVHMPVEQLVSLPPYSLEVVDGPPDLVGRTYPLPAREVTVGRGDQADFRLDCESISRLHASLTPQGPGEWLLSDLASLNGTFVADQRITQVGLRLGGELRLANTLTLRLVETGKGPSGRPAPE